MKLEFDFVHDERLGIAVPDLSHDWLEYSIADQEAMIARWETIRARIPDRVKELEEVINALLTAASIEDDWDRVVEHYEEMYRIASIINDLNIWNLIEPITASHAEVVEHGLADEHTNREK